MAVKAEHRYPDDQRRHRANPRFSVSRGRRRGGATYTSDTLRDLRALNPDCELYFITGADALGLILTWQGWEDLFDLAKFVGVSRPGYELTDSHIKDAVGKLPEDAIRLVEVPALAISSTDCRTGRPRASDLVPGARRVVQVLPSVVCTATESATWR